MTQKTRKKKNEWERCQRMFNRAETPLHQLPWFWYCLSLQPTFQNEHDETLLISSCFLNSSNTSWHATEITAKLNLDSINHRIIEYPELEEAYKDHQSPTPTLSSPNAMEYKDHTFTLVWHESRTGPALYAVEHYHFSPECSVPAGWIQPMWEASCATTNRSSALTRQITVWGCPETLPTHLLLCPVWDYTFIPSHSPSHTLVVMQGCVPEPGAYWNYHALNLRTLESQHR